MSTKSEANLNRPTKTQRVKRQRTNENFGKRKRTIVGKCDETGRLYKADIYLAVRHKGSCPVYTNCFGPSWPPRGDLLSSSCYNDS